MEINTEGIISELSENLEGLILCTFRYYLGRKTIQACMFAESLAEVFSELSVPSQKIIIRDLDRAFDNDSVGQSCDEEAWDKVREKYTHTYRCSQCGNEKTLHHHIMQDGVCYPVVCDNSCSECGKKSWVDHVEGMCKPSEECGDWN